MKRIIFLFRLPLGLNSACIGPEVATFRTVSANWHQPFPKLFEGSLKEGLETQRKSETTSRVRPESTEITRNLPIQHSSLAHGCVFTISGGSTPTFKHSTRATLTVFICNITRNSKKNIHYEWNIGKYQLTRSFIRHVCAASLAPSIVSVCLFFTKDRGNFQSAYDGFSSNVQSLWGVIAILIRQKRWN